MTTLTFSSLNSYLRTEYHKIVRASFPDIIFKSEVVKHCWPIIEAYFPEYQIFYVNDQNRIIGFINAIPFYWDKDLNELPDEGWDWLVNTGIDGYERKIEPNCLGGLQIIVAKDFLGQGYSKLLINEGKKIKEKLGFKNFLIPIRPTFKSNYPEMDMEDYINLKKNDNTYDPWIRTHLSSGATIIKVCSKAMHMYGDLSMWENLMNQKIKISGLYNVNGALNPAFIDVENDFGEYFEDNIWINYS